MNGIATLNMYELKPLPPEGVPNGDYITRQEFEQAITALTQSLQPQQQPSSQQQQPSTFKEVF